MFICIFFLTTHQILLFTIKTFFYKKKSVFFVFIYSNHWEKYYVQ